LDQQIFPYTKPMMDGMEDVSMVSQASLRSAKPTWARNRMSTLESRQRVLIFMAGGATYSEARACYEMSKTSSRDILLATSHMLTAAMFVRQVSDLSVDRRRLDIPADRPKPKPPAHLFEREERPRPIGLPGGPTAPGLGNALPRTPGAPLPPSKSPKPPIAGLAAMTLNSSGSKATNGNEYFPPASSSSHNGAIPQKAKLEKKSKKDVVGEEKEKKKRHFFGSKK